MSVAAMRRSYVQRYSIAMFYILAMLLGAGMISIVAQGFVRPELFLLAGVSSSIAGVIVTTVEDGRAGLRLMWNRLLMWRVKVGYWLFALFFLVAAVMIGSAINPLLAGDPIEIGDLQPVAPYILLFIAFVIVAGIGQELGWTGFLTPRLQVRFSGASAGFIRAVLVGLWHLPLLTYSWMGCPAFEDLHYTGWIGQIGLLPSLMALTLLFLLPLSILTTWMFNNTRGSLLLVAVLHGSEIWVAYWMINSGIDPSNLNNWWGYGAVLLAIAAAIVVINGAVNLSRNWKRIAY